MLRRLTTAKNWIIRSIETLPENNTWLTFVHRTTLNLLIFWDALVRGIIVICTYYILIFLFGSEAKFMKLVELRYIAQFALGIIGLKFLWSIIKAS